MNYAQVDKSKMSMCEAHTAIAYYIAVRLIKEHGLYPYFLIGLKKYFGVSIVVDINVIIRKNLFMDAPYNIIFHTLVQSSFSIDVRDKARVIDAALNFILERLNLPYYGQIVYEALHIDKTKAAELNTIVEIHVPLIEKYFELWRKS